MTAEGVPDLAALAPRIEAVVREAGAIGRDFFRKGARSWTKGDASPVTEADIAIDTFLKENLPPLVAGSGWLSEETADSAERLGRPLVWIVDPIDGTRSFVEGIPFWVVAVALVKDGRPIASAVYNPMNGDLFAAERGRGARLGGTPLAARRVEATRGARIAGPRRLLDHVERLGMVRSPWIYALALRLARIADGTIDAALASGGAHDWDIAASDLLIEETGGTLTDIAGRRPVYNRAETTHAEIVAAAEPLHGRLLPSVRASLNGEPTADLLGPLT